MGIMGIRGLLVGDYLEAVWLVWFVWFVFFIPKKS